MASGGGGRGPGGGSSAGAEEIDYYKVLDISRDASHDEIKAAFRRLAREKHPDKNVGNPNAEQEFQNIGEAWNVLRDEEKRKVYDSYGSHAQAADAVHFMEDWNSFDLETGITRLLISGFQTHVFFLCVILVVLAFTLLLPIFVMLRLDNDVRWAWGVVFIPVWICLCPMLCGCCCYMVTILGGAPITQADEEKKSLLAKLSFTSLLVGCCVTMFAICLCMKLGGTLHWSWVNLFIPLFVMEVLELYRSMRGLALVNEEVQVDSIVMIMLWTVVRMCFFIMVSLKLDDVLQVTWSVALIPLWAGVVLLVFQYFKSANEYCVARRKDESSHDASSTLSANRFSPVFLCIGAVGLISLVISLALAMQHLSAVDGAAPATHAAAGLKWSTVLTPLFVGIGVMFCITSCFVCCAGRIQLASNYEEVPQYDEEQSFGGGGGAGYNTFQG